MKNKTLQRIYKMLKPQAKSIAIISILAILINIGEVVKPYLIKIVIDDYLTANLYQKGIMTIGMIGAIYIAIVILGNILNFIVTTATSMMGENIIYSLRNKLYKYTQHANIPFHDKTPAGTLFVRITSDVEDITTLFKEVITTFIKDILVIVAFAVMMLSLNYQLALLSFMVIPFVILTSLIITKISNKLQEHSKVVKTKLNIFLAESIYGVKLIKIFNRQYEKQKECEGLCTDFWKSRVPLGITEALLVAILEVLKNVGVAIIVWASINHILGTSVDVGLIYVFVTYIKQIFAPINRLVENFETIQEALVSIDKIYDILEHKEYLENFEDGLVLKKVEGKIEFKNVWFAYQGEDWILKDISFTIEPGQSIALVGKTGSGKTTITNLINRFYEIQKGEILLDGINIKDINLRSLREKIGIILQDPFVFARSIKDNIQLNKNFSDEYVKKTIELASADEFVNSLPNGMEEISQERGSSYSSGEKQLLAFARIFAHNPSIFILDEATANIDTKTEELIQKSVDKISKEKTSIFIAHRLSTIVNVDKIIVLNQGEILEQGSHSELVSKPNGYYSKLYNAYYSGLVE
ncbi:MAG: ABC transporter ATP-binding protein [Clostridia bacterium]|nr:ABC transporter ATP-binding protein [Clostridia bacterium]